MKVYIIMWMDDPEKVFSTRERAQQWIEKQRHEGETANCEIVEMDVDAE